MDLKSLSLTYRSCSCKAQKVWIALEVAKTPYELEEVSLYGPGGKPDWFWDLNPDGTVPVLVCHGGAVIYPDSDLALDAIESGDALGEQTKSLAAVDKKTEQLVKEWRKSISSMLPIGKKAVLGGDKGKLMTLLKEMDAKVQGPYLCGDEITSADCAAFPFLWRLDNEFGLKGCENLRNWLQTCKKDEAFSKTVQSSWWWWW
jgi:glutathione S-transferase